MEGKLELCQRPSSQQDLTFKDDEWLNGNIKSITLENFMCHSNFHLPLNPRINIISGLNGGGNAAIKIALVVGFGAKANITDPASYIKYGCSSATIAIAIANGNETSVSSVPFRPNVYGKQITIVRQITDSGTISYKFLDEKGEVVRGYKNELKNLVLHFNILVDNPICVMDKATVETFHQSENACDKYDLFYHGIFADTHNNTIIELIKLMQKCSDEVVSMNQCFNEKKTQELNIFKKIENELAWCIFSKHQKNYEECKNQIYFCNVNIMLVSNKLKTLKGNMETISETILIKNNELSNFNGFRCWNHSVLMKKRKELQNKNNEQEIIKKNASMTDNEYQKLIDRRRELEQFIEVERERGESDLFVDCIRKLTIYKHDFVLIEESCEKIKENERSCCSIIEDLNQWIGNLSSEIANKQNKVNEISTDIENMSTRGSRINCYGYWVPQLVTTIEKAFRQKKFLKKPIGPIGEYIRVNNKEWVFSVENHLGRSTLGTFLVDNCNDNYVLQSIMDRVVPENERKPCVTIINFVVRKDHDISVNETDNSMYRMLTFTDPVVENYLIDNNCIEKIMLVNNLREVTSLMENTQRNCNFILTLDGTQVSPNPPYELFPMQNPREPIFLQNDILSTIKSLKRAKKELEASINGLNNECKHINYSKSKKEHRLNNFKYETRSVKSLYVGLQDKINVLTAIKEEHETRMAVLTEEINDVDLKIATAAKSKEDILKPLPANEMVIVELEKRVNELQAVDEDYEKSAIEEQIETLQTQMYKCETEMTEISNNLSELQKTLMHLTKQAEIEKTNAETVKQEAKLFCEKILVSRSEEDIKRDLESSRQKCRLLNAIELNNNGDFNVDTLEIDYENKQQTYIEKFNLHKKTLNHFKANKASVEVNTVLFKNYIDNFSLKIIESFNKLLKWRNIQGKIDIDNHSKSMVITMSENGIGTSCAFDEKRAFATVALILALWNNIESPFYFIDEYDVYMDDVNRLATTQMLMKEIEKRKNQFIFLTSQDISHIGSALKIKIVKL